MAQVQARRPRGGECQGHQVVQPDGGDGDAERRLIAPADASGQAAHCGGPVVEVDDAYDSKVKIGEALEAAARAVGDQPVRGSDAAAISSAEASAGAGVVPGGVAEQAQAAADANAGAAPPAEDTAITIGDVLAVRLVQHRSTRRAFYLHLMISLGHGICASFLVERDGDAADGEGGDGGGRGGGGGSGGGEGPRRGDQALRCERGARRGGEAQPGGRRVPVEEERAATGSRRMYTRSGRAVRPNLANLACV